MPTVGVAKEPAGPTAEWPDGGVARRRSGPAAEWPGGGVAPADAVLNGVIAMFYQLVSRGGTVEKGWYNYLAPTTRQCMSLA